jgi:maleate isomerase
VLRAGLTPYARTVNDDMATFLIGRGIGITNVAGFDLDSDEAMTAVPPAAIFDAGLQACDPTADLLFVSCTALRASAIVAALEDRLGRPVVAGNPALLWKRCVPVGGFGRLFDQPLPT